MKKLLFICLIVLSACSSRNSQWEQIESNFQSIPNVVRPNPLWFWNDTEVKSDELMTQMENHIGSGYGGLSILPFGKNFQPDYLSDEYFARYSLCVEKASDLNAGLWIYDEYGFPSGTAGDINGDGIGRFKQRYPEHTTKRLDKTEYAVKANTAFDLELPDELLMAVVAMDTTTLQRIDLQGYITNNRLKWDVPQGNWRIMVFSCVNDGNTIVDYMSPEAVKLYIGMTHEEYAKRFGEYFGTTVKGTFFDEPTLYYAQGRSWTPLFNEKFKETHGFDPTLYYPALWYNIGEETEEARNYLFGFRSELYAEGYTKLVNDWSKKHGLLATGHQDNEEVINPVGTSGDLMKCFKYLDVPGIDKIGGDRPAERFYKVVSSAAYNWDHSLVMSETYGAMGNISWDEIYDIAIDQYAKGINLLIPHAVWYDTSNVVFKPELSYRSPIYAEGLKEFTNYLSRLNAVMQNEGRWVGDIAVLYPIESMQSQHYMDGPLGSYGGGVTIPDMDYVNVGVNLFDSLGYDFQFIHPEVLDNQIVVYGTALKLDNAIQYNSFSTLVIPSSKVISLSNMRKIEQFAAAGGTVIFTTQLPQQATRVKDNEALKSIIQKLSSQPNVVLVKDPTPDNLEAAFAGIKKSFALQFKSTDRVKNIRKVWEGKNIWFLANPGEKSKNVEICLSGKFDLQQWNPHTGSIEDIETTIEGNNTLIKLRIENRKSLFLIEK